MDVKVYDLASFLAANIAFRLKLVPDAPWVEMLEAALKPEDTMSRGPLMKLWALISGSR